VARGNGVGGFVDWFYRASRMVLAAKEYKASSGFLAIRSTKLAVPRLDSRGENTGSR
jgi:hypothetical protein